MRYSRLCLASERPQFMAESQRYAHLTDLSGTEPGSGHAGSWSPVYAALTDRLCASLDGLLPLAGFWVLRDHLSAVLEELPGYCAPRIASSWRLG